MDFDFDDFRFPFIGETVDHASGYWWRNCETGEMDGPFPSLVAAEEDVRTKFSPSLFSKE